MFGSFLSCRGHVFRLTAFCSMMSCRHHLFILFSPSVSIWMNLAATSGSYEYGGSLPLGLDRKSSRREQLRQNCALLFSPRAVLLLLVLVRSYLRIYIVVAEVRIIELQMNRFHSLPLSKT